MFVCPEYSRKGRSYFYHRNSDQYELVYRDSHRYQTIIESLDDAGEYCCTKHHGVTLMLNKSHSCVQVEGMLAIIMHIYTCSYYLVSSSVVPTKIEWGLPENNFLQGNGNISGNCTLTGNPAPTGELDILGCDYNSSITVVDKYTVAINFTIYPVTNVTQSCHIYCHSTTHAEEKTLVISTTTTGDANITDDIILPPLNKSTPTSPGEVPNEITSTSTSNISMPTSNDGISEQRDKVSASTDTEEQTATIMMMLILIVVILMILMLLMAVTLLSVIWMTIRVTNPSQKL